MVACLKSFKYGSMPETTIFQIKNCSNICLSKNNLIGLLCAQDIDIQKTCVISKKILTFKRNIMKQLGLEAIHISFSVNY